MRPRTRFGGMLTVLCLVLSSSALQILHLADFHLDVDYSVDGDNQHMCHNTTKPSQSRLGPFGDYMCDSPKSLVEHAVDEAKRLVPSPDLIIWTGDNVPHVDGYDWNYVINAMNLTTTLLFSRFPNRTILPTFGNHDYAPANAFDKNSTLYSAMWEMWKGMLDENEKERFILGGYYKHLLANSTVLVLNTNLYYNINSAFVNFTNKDDPAGQFAFMESEMKSAMLCRKNGTTYCSPTVHIVAHIAPGAFERTPNYTWFRDQYNERFLNLTVDYADVIGMMLFGHHHTDTFHLIKNSSGSTVQFALMSPAVTPWFSSLKGAGANNPAFRTYDVDASGQIHDIVTYYVDLDKLNTHKETPFVEEYAFKKAYNISGLIDTDSMSDLLERMKTDDELFQAYIKFNSVLWKPEVPEGVFRGGQLCSMEFADYPRYYECLSRYNVVNVHSLNFFLGFVVIVVDLQGLLF